MNILIIGDGKVGYTLARLLSQENYDVTVMDNNAAALSKATETLDVLCVKGNASSFQSLKEAGAGVSDIVIAVTSSDELNMICSLFSHKLGAQHIVARIRNPEYITSSSILMQDLGIDMVINPELICAQEISRLLRFPFARSVESFANGQIEMVEFKVNPNSTMKGKSVESISRSINLPVLFCAVTREGKMHIPHGQFVFEIGDSVFTVGEPHALHQFFKALGYARDKVRHVTIVGGSRIAFYLAQSLSRMIGYGGSCKIIEIDEKRCEVLSESLPDVMIIHGDGSDAELLRSENIAEMDACIALMDFDEKNIICAFDAAQMGAKKVICKVTRDNYSRVFSAFDIGNMVNPKELAARRIARYVHSLHGSKDSFIESTHEIAGGEAEVVEFTVNKSSKLLGTKLKDLPFKNDVLVCAIIYNDKLIVPNGDSVINKGASIIVTSKNISFDDVNDILN